MEEINPDEFLRNHANMTADVIIGKNLEKHLDHINNLLGDLNYHVDQFIKDGKPVVSLYDIGFNTYSLRDEIIRQLTSIPLLRQDLDDCLMANQLTSAAYNVNLEKLDPNTLALISIQNKILLALHKFSLNALVQLNSIIIPEKPQDAEA
ncbi:MAG: hypothetical protein ACYCZO_10070 [Daejeonella sp.]